MPSQHHCKRHLVLQAAEACAAEYTQYYLPELQRLRQDKAAKDARQEAKRQTVWCRLVALGEDRLLVQLYHASFRAFVCSASSC